MRRKLGRTKSGTVHLSGIGSATASSHGVLTVAQPPATTVEGRLERLEDAMQDLQRKQREDLAMLEGRISEARKQAAEAHTALQTRLAELEARRKQNLRESMTFERWGIGLFIVGVILSVLGNPVTC